MNILIHWKPEYSVNIKEIDQQHKKLFDLINWLYDSIVRNEKDDIIEQILIELKDYAFVHFKDEEKYLVKAREMGYMESDPHMSEHNEFINVIEKFHQKYINGNPQIKQEVVEFLQRWITQHIINSDKKYMKYLINYHNVK